MDDFQTWEPELRRLAEGVRTCTCAALAEEDPVRLARPAGEGAGDVTFGLDLPSEEWLDAWLEERARHGPLSLLTEDRGWRHLGPAPGGGAPRALAGFDHGGPRISVDPIDGTRNLMADLRSAWTVVGFAPPGPDEPRLSDLTGGLVAEIPTARAGGFRVLIGGAPGCRLEERAAADGRLLETGSVRVDDDDRPDQGYFPFFRYRPELRPALAHLEAAFFERLERHEGADLRSVYDDQYISNAGQLVLLSLGTYRMIVDARALVARRAGTTTVTSKPYDLSGAVVCARAAGCELTAADGGPLDFPLDAHTPVDFAGYANPATRRRLEPHWLETLARAPE